MDVLVPTAVRDLARTLFVALASSCVGACKSPPLPEPTSSAQTIDFSVDRSAYGLGPNDILSVVVYGHEELSTPAGGTRVARDGTLSLPLLDPIPVYGRDPSQLRDVVRERLSAFVNEPKVSVSVVEYGAAHFYLLGEVREPGPHTLDRAMTALQALSYGGGFEPRADRDEVVLLRPHDDGFETHLFNAATPGPDGLVYLKPDDILFVRRTGAGRFADQMGPYIDAGAVFTSAAAQMIIAVDAVND